MNVKTKFFFTLNALRRNALIKFNELYYDWNTDGLSTDWLGWGRENDNMYPLWCLRLMFMSTIDKIFLRYIMTFIDAWRKKVIHKKCQNACM